jgi:hypothetical protein
MASISIFFLSFHFVFSSYLLVKMKTFEPSLHINRLQALSFQFITLLQSLIRINFIEIKSTTKFMLKSVTLEPIFCFVLCVQFSVNI